MTSVLSRVVVPAPALSPPRRRGRLPAYWPLAVALIGYPIWWVVGISSIVPILAAAVMTWQLLHRRRLHLPPGFRVWLLFLVWVAGGVLLLGVDAPGAVAAPFRPSQLLTFGYRLAWYLSCTVALLWIGNMPEEEVPRGVVHKSLGAIYIIATAGGLAGILFASVEIKSLVELVVPHGLGSNAFVKSLIHPVLADVQTVLGYDSPRPAAPFQYANSWGASMAMSLPFLVLGWLRDRRAIVRLVGLTALILSAAPIIYSLNRGLWGSLLLGLVIGLALQIRDGRVLGLGLALGAVAVGIALFAASPLGTMVSERLANPHSNDRRSELAVETVASTARGSPIAGFGSTREVQGSFASISGGDTADCTGCGVPPFGTQGHLWLVLFTQGFGGLALFLTFFVTWGVRVIRCRGPAEATAFMILAFFGLQLFVYDTLGLPLFIVMLTLGLVWREQRQQDPRLQMNVFDLSRLIVDVRRRRVIIAACAVIGVAVGVVVGLAQPQRYAARTAILLASSPVSYSAGVTSHDTVNRSVTIDTEAALAKSATTLRRVLETNDPEQIVNLQDDVTITAVPNTEVMLLSVAAVSAPGAEALSSRVSDSYLQTRQTYLTTQRDRALTELRVALRSLESFDIEGLDVSRASRLTTERLTAINDATTAIAQLELSPTSAGAVLRHGTATPVRRQVEVPIVSGALLGVFLGSLSVLRRPRPSRRRRAISEPVDQDYVAAVASLWPQSGTPLLVRRGDGRRGHELMLLPNARHPRMALPADRVAAARALLRFSSGLSRRETAQRIALAGALRGAGTHLLADRVRVAESAGSLREHISELLDTDVSRLSMTLGPPRPNRKPVLEVFDHRGRSLGFVKVGLTPVTRQLVRAEAQALTALDQTPPIEGIQRPRLLASSVWRDNAVLVMSPLATRPSLQPSRAWDLPHAQMEAFARQFDGETLPLTDTRLWQLLHFSAASMLPADASSLVASLARIGDAAEGLSFDIGCWHGDWTPWNQAWNKNVLQLWDFERFQTGVPIGLDRLHYAQNLALSTWGHNPTSIARGLRLAGLEDGTAQGELFVLAACHLAAVSVRHATAAAKGDNPTARKVADVLLTGLRRLVTRPTTHRKVSRP